MALSRLRTLNCHSPHLPTASLTHSAVVARSVWPPTTRRARLQTRQPELACQRVEALAQAVPLAWRPWPLNQALDPGRPPELEPLALPNRFPLGRHPLVAKGVVAAHQGGTFLGVEPLDRPAPARQAGVVADLGTRPVAIQPLEGGGDVEDPGGAQGFAGAFVQGRVHPGRCASPQPSDWFGARCAGARPRLSSPGSPATCASRRCPARIDRRQVPGTSTTAGTLGRV